MKSLLLTLVILAISTLSSAPVWADSIQGASLPTQFTGQVFGPGFLVSSFGPNADNIACNCNDPEFGNSKFAVYGLNSTDAHGFLDFADQNFEMAVKLFDVVYTPTGSPNFVNLEASFTGFSNGKNPIAGTFYEYQNTVYGVPGTDGWTIGGSVNFSEAPPVGVPDGDSAVLLSLGALAAVGLAFCLKVKAGLQAVGASTYPRPA
jgi:hypothetical protein